MAMTRKALKAMGLTDEQIDSIIEMHTETRQGKQHHRAYQEAIESQSEVRDGLDLLAQVDDDNE